MILKLKIKKTKKPGIYKIYVWIQQHEEFEQDIEQLFQFFKNQIHISNIRRILKYYRVTSDNPAVIMSLFSALHDLIPEIYFKQNDELEIKEILND